MLDGKTQPSLSCVDKLRGFHVIYCEEAENPLSLTNFRMDQWARWETNGWTADDLRCVIRYIKRRFYDKNRPHICRGMLHFKRLIEPEWRETGPDYSYFEQYLCDARADQRNYRPPPSAKQTVLAQANRPEQNGQGSEVKRVDQIAQDLSADYDALRKAAGL